MSLNPNPIGLNELSVKHLESWLTLCSFLVAQPCLSVRQDSQSSVISPSPHHLSVVGSTFSAGVGGWGQIWGQVVDKGHLS